MLNFPITVPITSPNLNHVQAEFTESFDKVADVLKSTKKISSINDVKRIKEIYMELEKYLPGPITPEKLTRYDERNTIINWCEFANNKYAILLQLIVEKFDSSYFPLYKMEFDENILNLFMIDNNWEFLNESLTILLDTELLFKNIQSFTFILERMLGSKTLLFAAFVDMSHNSCRAASEIEIFDYENRCNNLIQLLISLPNKLANVLQRETNSIFLPERYCKVLIVNFLKSLIFAAEHNSHCIDCDDDYKYNSIFFRNLLQKIIVHFNFDKQSATLNKLIDVLFMLVENSKYRMIINDIMHSINRSAIDIIAFMIFKQPHSAESMNKLLGNSVVTSNDWNYMLTRKLPLLNYYDSDTVIENLVCYLATVTDCIDHYSSIENLLISLLSTWSSKESIWNVSFEQHYYVTKFIILIVHYLLNFKNVCVSEGLKDKITQSLYSGITHHLNSLDKNIRCVGMITSEIIMNKLTSNLEEKEKLAFDYGTFDATQKDIVEVLSNLQTKVKQIENKMEESKMDNVGCIKLLMNELEESVQVNSVVAKSERILPKAPVKSKLDVFELKTNKITVQLNEPNAGNDEDDLDSDDDLEPYSMENDEIQILDKQPKYLADLRDGLLSENDGELFEVSMKACEDLIIRQLPDNDLKMGIDLLRLLLNLESTTYLENFNEMRFSSCIAICCVFPKECATYLCESFHAEVGKYSISRRILFLNLLAETAKKLSQINYDKNNKDKAALKSASNNTGRSVNKLTTEQDENEERKRLAELVIRERILSKTRRFATKTKHPLKSGIKNKYADVAGCFFFPLLHGFGRKQFIFTSNMALKCDTDYLQLITFLNTISVLMLCAENCPIAGKMAREVFNLSIVLRFNDEPKIRLGTLQMLGAIFMAVPKMILRNEFLNELLELKHWLEECVQTNVLRNESNLECREISRNLLYMCINVFAD